MNLPPSPDGGFYGWVPAAGSPRWPWVAWLFRCSGLEQPNGRWRKRARRPELPHEGSARAACTDAENEGRA
jgi:hypothetical protein